MQRVREKEADEDEEEGEEEIEIDQLTQEPERIICHSLRGKYLVKLQGEESFFSQGDRKFAIISADKIKQLRAEPQEVQEQAFNGFGTKLLNLSDQYERFCRKFDADAEECNDMRGGLDFDLMRPDSSMDVCALLGFLKTKEVGGLLSQKRAKSMGPTRGRKVEDCMIAYPALQLSMVTQRLLDIWKARALEAEAKLAAHA